MDTNKKKILKPGDFYGNFRVERIANNRKSVWFYCLDNGKRRVMEVGKKNIGLFNVDDEFYIIRDGIIDTYMQNDEVILTVKRNPKDKSKRKNKGKKKKKK